MEHRTKRNHPLRDLVSEFEAMCQNGNITYLEEKTFFQLIHYYEDADLLHKAIDATSVAIEQHCYCADLLITKARLLLLKDKPYLALKYLDKAEIIAPSELDIILLRARIFTDLGEYDQAVYILHEARKYHLGSDLVDLYMAESSVYERMKDFDRMFLSLANTLRLEPLNELALERIWLSVELSKRYRDSIRLHSELLDRDAYSYLAWFNIGHAYACLGEYELAIQALEYSYLIEPAFEQGFIDCAEFCFQVKDYKKALETYMELSENFGEECENLVKIAECYYHLDQVHKAREVLIYALKMDPYDDEVYYNLARCFAAEGKYENAASALIKAIEIENRREEYYADLALAYIELKEFSKADFYFKKSTEIGPEQEIYWRQHVSFLIGLKEYTKALHVLDESEYYTVGPGLSYCRVICLLNLDNRKKALKILDEALTDDFPGHEILFDLSPDLKADKDIVSMLNYYNGERVNSLH